MLIKNYCTATNELSLDRQYNAKENDGFGSLQRRLLLMLCELFVGDGEKITFSHEIG